MKVLFVVKSTTIETLGPMYLASVVKHAGHECKIIELDQAFMFSKLWKPDIIGYSVMTGDQAKVKNVNEQIIDWWPAGMKVPMVIVGGPHPTFFPEDFSANNGRINGCDYIVVTGEGENIMNALLNFRHSYPDIDSFPWPDRADFPDHRIRDFITSRGCPYNCSYCYNDRWAKMFPALPRVRTRSVGDVILEIDNVGPEFVYFQDSCFALDINWFRDFSKKYRAKINIPYHCHMRPNQITEEQVLLLHDSNCMSVRIALESASSRLRDLMNRKNTDLDKVLKAVRLLKKWNIKLMIQNILALPTSTIEDDLETLEFNIRCHPAYSWSSIFSPYPGTELGDKCKKEGYYKGNYDDITDCFFDKSLLDFPEEQKEQTYCLQKIFALCVEIQVMPQIKDLTYGNLPKFIHFALRKLGDRRLYGDIL